MRRYLACGLIALLSACSKGPSDTQTDAQAPPANTSPTLSAAGVGAIRFGMTLKQAEQATGSTASLPQPFDPACSMVRFAPLPRLRFMLENGIVTRADAEPGVDNVLGIGVGATPEQVRARYPKAEVSPHKYDENGHYFTFPSTDGRSAIVLEETGGKVSKVRAGLQPAVAYVETCG